MDADLDIDNIEYLDEEYIDQHDFEQAFENVVIKTEIIDDAWQLPQDETANGESDIANIMSAIGNPLVAHAEPQSEPCHRTTTHRTSSDHTSYETTAACNIARADCKVLSIDNISYDGILEEEKAFQKAQKEKQKRLRLEKWARYVRFKYEEYTCDMCGKM